MEPSEKYEVHVNIQEAFIVNMKHTIVYKHNEIFETVIDLLWYIAIRSVLEIIIPYIVYVMTYAINEQNDRMGVVYKLSKNNRSNHGSDN